ncbi:hypothetical protein [Streptomyces sp. NPDC005374]
MDICFSAVVLELVTTGRLSSADEGGTTRFVHFRCPGQPLGSETT